MNRVYKREFDLQHIFLLIRKSMKQCLIFFVIGILIGASLTYGLKLANVKVSVGSANTSEYASATEKLSYGEIEMVNEVYNSYTEMVKQRDDLQKFLKNSAYLNADILNGKGKRLVYVVNANANSQAVSDSIKALLVNEKLYTSTNKLLKNKVSFSTFSQLIQVTNQIANNSVIMNNDNDVALSIDVYATNMTDCITIEKQIRNHMNDLSTNLKKLYPQMTINYVGDSVNSISDYNLTGQKSNYATQLANISTAITSLKNTLSTDEGNYFDYLLKNEGAQVKYKTVFSKVTFIKYTLLVGVLALVAYVCMIIIKYLNDNKLHTVNEITKIFKLKLLRKFDVEESRSIIKEELNFDKASSTLLITSAYESSPMIKDLLNDQQIENDFIVLKEIPNNENDFNKIREAKTAILVEEVNVSSVDKIGDIVEYLNSKEIEILGAITFYQK